MLKKILFGFAAMLSLAACTGDYTDWAEPQHNDQPATVAFGNGSVAEVSTIDLATIADGQELVKVCNITAPTASVEGYAPEYTITLGDQTFPLTANGEMAVADLNDYVVKTFGQRPVERAIPATVSMWVNNGTTAVKTATSAVFNVKATPEAPVIYEHFYLIGGIDGAEWNPTCTAMPFTHSDKDVYEDPVFTIMAPVAEGENWFAFADDLTVSTNDWSNVFAAKEGNGLNLVGETGNLCRRNELTADAGDGSFKVVVDGDAKFIKITVNLLERTYLIEKINFDPVLYYVGTANGWTNDANNKGQSLILTDVTSGTYSGYLYCKQEDYGNTFRLFTAAQLGQWGTCTGASEFDSFDGMQAGGSDNNIEATAGDGVYLVELSLVKRSIKATKINNMNLVGDFNGWNQADDAQQMTWDAANYCFVKENAGVTANGWKFTANNEWGINLGGTVNDLVANGDNLGVAGTTIKLYPCHVGTDKIYCTVE